MSEGPAVWTDGHRGWAVSAVAFGEVGGAILLELSEQSGQLWDWNVCVTSSSSFTLPPCTLCASVTPSDGQAARGNLLRPDCRVSTSRQISKRVTALWGAFSQHPILALEIAILLI